ncbi:WD40 repeat domain-containing protein [Streptomyces sp. NPDC055059]|uniref:WD40 repeat domain-containing protein n=1 Tax=Streptomyces sp. NPDC127172 TaxID=3345382 RepID=UPI003639D3D4
MRLWDRASGKQTATLIGHTEPVLGVAVSPDGTWLATTGNDATVRIWDRASEQVRTMMRTDGRLFDCVWTSDGFGPVAGGDRGAYFYEFRPGAPCV